MTNLPLTPAKGYIRPNVPEWGTNKMVEKSALWSAKSPNWHLTGEPIEQFYDLTLLKKSNVRSNDQLLPKPQESTIGDKMIHLPFPADHPFASHVPRLKMFPSFAQTAEEPKRGVLALQTRPLSSETPSSNYDVTIINQTKGSGVRHEAQSLPPMSMKRGLSWHGEHGFPQHVKIYGDRSEYYPTPTSMLVPNLLDRSGTEHALSDTNANVTRNLERQQWKTTYERNHSGIGPVNQYKLDNLQDKRQHAAVTGGEEDDNLYPWFSNTYEQARPQEGRLAMMQNPNYGVPSTLGAAQPPTDFKRKATLREVEEDRLLNGKSYTNLPASPEKEQWMEWSSINDPQDRFAALIEKQMREAPNPLPFVERGTGTVENVPKVGYVSSIATQHHDKIQQMEAEDRWQQLEAYKPAHSLQVLKRKESLCTPEQSVSAFYGHEGKYNEERAGLYKTSYNPDSLVQKLDSDPSKLNIRNNVSSAQDAIHFPTDINMDADIIRTSIYADPRNTPMFSDRPDVYEVYEPFKRDRFVREQQLQPNIRNARPRVQEGGAILTDSTMGSGYNTQLFLQENKVSPFARSEPLALMSTANQNLANVRVNSTKQVKFSDQITVGEGAGSAPLQLSKANIETPKIIIQSSTAPPKVPTAFPMPTPAKNAEFKSMERSAAAFRLSTPSRVGESGGNGLFASKSSNLGIGATSDMFQSSYDSQFKGDKFLSENDMRYSWEPGCGVPRPQTSLLKLQNQFTKSDAHRSLRERFPETNPSLIDNVRAGKKHTFGALNSQVLRGTLINA